MIYDAIVIGGGPAGGTSALLLAKAGWSVAVVEKAVFPRRKVCGEFISATTLPLLEALGVSQTFLGAAGPAVRRVGFFAGQSVVSAPMPQTRGGRFRWGHALGREHLDKMILDAAAIAGAEIFQPWAAADIVEDGSLYRCGITSDGTNRDLFGRIVIAANGSWERGPLSPKTPPHRASDLLGFKAHFRDAALPVDLMPMLVFRGGYAGMVHTDGGRMSLSCCIRRDQLKKSRAALPGHSAGEAVLQHIASSCRGARDVLASASLDGPWLSAGPIRPGINSAPRDGTFFAGNMAGEAHPIIAEGISMAIQSAWLLSRRLIAGDPENARDRASGIRAAYEREWRRFFGPRVRTSIALNSILTGPCAAQVAGRIVRLLPSALTFGARVAGKATAVPTAL